jgi:hypothetical protein
MLPSPPPQEQAVSALALLRRVPRASWAALGAVGVLAGVVAIVWRDLIDLNQPFDPLLAGLWLGMALLLAWRIRPRRDLVLVFSALCGGFLIEWWGTTTELWTYFTGERPPLWIVPAWPVAALATDRLTRLAERVLPSRQTWLWWLPYLASLSAFVLWMLVFMRPGFAVASSKVVLAIMVVVTLAGARPRRDLALFFAGTALGWLLEYWGTTRNCWTYYTQQTPPLVTAFAHGFASVSFARATDALLWGLRQARAALARVETEPPEPSGGS